MKKKTVITTILILLAALIVSFVVFSSGDQSATSDSPETATSTQGEAEGISATLASGTYEVSTGSSTVTWTAYKTPVDGYEDVGTFPVDGSIAVASDGRITATTTFDVADLNVTSVSGPGSTEKLASHLRSEDFFATDQYPTATLKTTQISPGTTSSSTYNVTADLTMKGVTKEINFPAEIGMQNDNMIVLADTEIDRTRWNIRYGSKSFFDNLGDNVIGDMVDISVNLVATPSSDDSTGTTTAEN
jgi:polyisoprenoid-binding protein YceI